MGIHDDKCELNEGHYSGKCFCEERASEPKVACPFCKRVSGEYDLFCPDCGYDLRDLSIARFTEDKGEL